MSQSHNTDGREQERAIPASGATGEQSLAAWEMIEAGRYRPRRIRGSFPGRELGWTFVIPPGQGGREIKKPWRAPRVTVQR